MRIHRCESTNYTELIFARNAWVRKKNDWYLTSDLYCCMWSHIHSKFRRKMWFSFDSSHSKLTAHRFLIHYSAPSANPFTKLYIDSIGIALCRIQWRGIEAIMQGMNPINWNFDWKNFKSLIPNSSPSSLEQNVNMLFSIQSNVTKTICDRVYVMSWSDETMWSNKVENVIKLYHEGSLDRCDNFSAVMVVFGHCSLSL